MICLNRKNKILFSITGIALVLLFMSFFLVEMVDLEHLWIPAIIYLLSVTWLYLFGVANTPKRKR